jgi:hypothetical protein
MYTIYHTLDWLVERSPPELSAKARRAMAGLPFLTYYFQYSSGTITHLQSLFHCGSWS